MKGSSLSLRILLRWGPLLLLTGLSLCLWALSTVALRSLLKSRFEAAARNETQLLSLLVLDLAGRGERPTAERLAAWTRDLGVTARWIRADGSVVSAVAGDTTRILAGRPEVLEARNRGTGRAVSRADRRDAHSLHLTRAFALDDGTGVLRVSFSTDSVDAALAEAHGVLAAVTLLAIVVGLVLGLFLSRRIVAPLEELQGSVDGASLDRLDSPGLRSRRAPREISELSDAVDRLRRELTSRVGTLTRSHEQLQAVLTATSEGMLILSSDFRVLHANGAARRLLGLSRETASGGRVWEWIRSPELEELLSTLPDSGAPYQGEITVLREQGEMVLQATVTTCRRAGPDDCEHILILQDVTDSQRLERMRREFVANISHELKTPLTSITGFAETLLSGGLDDEENNARFVRKIKRQADRLVRLIDELLDLSRIESARQKLDLGPVDFAEVVRDAVREHEESLRDAGIRLDMSLPAAPVHVHADRRALARIVSNLIDNATKYSPRDSGVRLRVTHAGESGCVIVQDTGSGIPENEISRIFERFYRGSRSRDSRIEGTGLGLSIVKHLVQAMEGRIEVHSRPGEGSRFTACFPLSKPLERA